MRLIIALIIMISLTGLVSAEKKEFKLQISDFFGECNYSDMGLMEVGRCTSNFLSPIINYNLLLDPFTQLYSSLTGSDILDSFDFFINFGTNIIRFLLHFAFKFALVYLLWISLGFQVLINLVDRNKILEHEEKISATFLVIGVATLYTMINGLGVVL